MVLVLAGCGPAVEEESASSGEGSTSAVGSSGSTSDTPVPDPPDPDPPAMTSTSTTGPVGTDTGFASTGSTGAVATEGAYFFAMRLIIAESTPLQFVGEAKADGEVVAMTLTPLSLDLNSTDAPREEVPPAIELTGDLDPDGVFRILASDLELPGNVNPITGSDIVATLRIEGAFEGENICGRVSGMVTAPANIDLTGSTLSAIPYDGGELPAVEQVDCSG